ncbi:MAG: UPF0182 family protein [Candidatus Woesearchaeota archaeon]
MKAFNKNLIVVVLIALILLFFTFSNLLVEYFWIDSVGYLDVFQTTVEATLFLFLITFLVSFIFIIFNLYLSSKFSKDKLKKSFNFKIKLLVALIISIIFARLMSFNWFEFMSYLKQVPHGVIDPIFGKDLSFYVFSLHFYQLIIGFGIFCVIVTIILVLFDYFQSFVLSSLKQISNPTMQKNADGTMKSANFRKEQISLKKHAFFHLSILFSILFLLFSLNHYFSRFSALNSPGGAVFGAGYTEINVIIPALSFLSFFAFFISIFFLVWCVLYINKKLRLRHLFGLLIVYFLLSFVLLSIIPYFVQTLKVSPNEINLEREFIQYNINFTRMAYGLNEIEEIEFDSVGEEISWDTIDNNRETIDNIRLLDQRPLTQTYRQTQEMRLYYDLSSIDIDRYNINGNYTQVMISAREMDQKKLASSAQTWVNQHLIYTHGYGAVMSPVNKVTTEGLPDYLIKDIPPIYTVDDKNLIINQSEIYYGELDSNHVFVNSDTPEFNYPEGSSNKYKHYDGDGGIVLDSFFKKFLMAIKFKDFKVLLSSEITPETKIQFHRNIKVRTEHIMPFLKVDDDPYVVINDGRLFWIMDGYTLTSNYPYSDNNRMNNLRFNYIRNSVKIVVDAYNGDVSYYVVDINDPLIKTYKGIFQESFKDMDEMPAGLKKHIRYPEDLFRIQSNILQNYHMKDYMVFYNKEDAWQIPNEIYGQGNEIKMDPYYIIMKLLDDEEEELNKREEFVLMTPFTPIQKNNMISWLAARADGDNYGKLLLYRFPKDKLIYGPMQIEARIDQDSYISQQFTLWSQRGSSVLRGNLMIIPIDNSLLYVEPIYLESQRGQLPQLVRVIVSDGTRIVMEKTLTEALEVLVGIRDPIQEIDEDGALIVETDQDLIIRANKVYEEILESMKRTDWSSIGSNLDDLGTILSDLLADEAIEDEILFGNETI